MGITEIGGTDLVNVMALFKFEVMDVHTAL
jgi:hypothetical protein